MHNPPSLEEMGRAVGCSPFYLSRQFARETGLTIQQYLRQVRLERAAQLLRTGKCNVTEAALAVGYASLSHFTVAFRETFGCCPGLYRLQTATQRGAPKDASLKPGTAAPGTVKESQSREGGLARTPSLPP